MIKLTHLHKFYNKGKNNEIHVLNDIDITLPDHGFITFFGPSGSGKTTLLNVIGGLDKAKGTIAYDDTVFTNYPMGKTDAYRRENIGYVFQNYQLLTELSVYDNLQVALDAIGLTDKDECSRRISYCLKKVGMYSYRKKPAGALSGGQMQRVSIARALVRNAKIIIADEPTGNLDSQNSLEIMSILKRISKTSLVLLVTHNPSLAEFYSDTIMEIHDGKITAIREGKKDAVLDEAHLNKIYLGDLVKSEIHSETLNADVYQESGKKLTLQVIEHNGQYFLRSSEKIKLLDDSPFVLLEGKKSEENITRGNAGEFDYDTSFYEEKARHHKIPFFHDLKTAFQSFFQRGKKGARFFKFAFLIIGIIMAFTDMTAVQAFYSTKTISYADDTYVLNGESDDLTLTDTEKNFIKKAIQEGNIDALVGYPKTLMLNSNITSFLEEEMTASGYSLDASLLTDKDLVYGRLPSSENEFVISEGMLKNLLRTSDHEYSYKSLCSFSYSFTSSYGIDSWRLVGVSKSADTVFYVSPTNYYSAYTGGMNVDFTIDVGYVRYEDYRIVYGEDASSEGDFLVSLDFVKDSLNVTEVDFASADFLEFIEEIKSSDFRNYLNGTKDSLTFRGVYDSESCFCDYLTCSTDYFSHDKNKYGDYALSVMPKNEASYHLLSGRDIENPYEILVSPYSCYEIGDEIFGCTVVGTYRYDSVNSFAENGNYYYSNKDYAYYAISDFVTYQVFYNSLSYNENYFHTRNPEALLKTAKENGIDLQLMESCWKQEVRKESKDQRTTYGITFAVLMVLVSVYIYFTMRSKMIKDIYTIGVERSLGFSRTRIVLRSVADILITTTFTSFIGYAVTCFILHCIQNSANSIGLSVVAIGSVGMTYLLGFGLFVISLIFGLLPILTLLTKTPAEITSKYDI